MDIEWLGEFANGFANQPRATGRYQGVRGDIVT